MKEHGICAKCKKSVGCPYADDRIMGCKNFVLEHELKLTNKEWIRQCDTEQLAKFIFWQHFDVYGKTLYELMVNASKGVSRDKQAEVMIGAVVEWLKEKHHAE